MKNSFEIETALEEVIDLVSLSTALDKIVAICYDKASHIEDNSQDAGTAKRWDKAANIIARAAVQVSALGL
jgi:hypothetical protein